MTIRNRLLFSFSMITIMLLIFGLYQNYEYSVLASSSTKVAHIVSINEEAQVIKSAQVDYLLKNNRHFVSVIFDALIQMDDNIQTITRDGKANKSHDDLQQIKSTLSEYETVFNQFISNNDQYNAIKSKVIQNQTDLLSMVKTIADTPNLNQYLASNDLFFDMLIITQADESDPSTHVDELNRIVRLGDRLLSEGNSFTAQLLGQRIKTSAKQHLEIDESLQVLLRQNIELADQLSQKLQEIEIQTSNLVQKQQAEALNSMNQLRQTYLIISSFILILIITLMYRLSKRITNSLTHLIKGTELIASGEYTVNLTNNGSDEFAEIANSINTMAQSLKIANFSIRTYSTQLENMVAAKTSELTKAKEELERVNQILGDEKERFATLAMTDVLTGLNNRAFLIQVLTQKISEASRYLRPFSIMLLDIDFFKSVNDRFGHQVGDDVLKVISDVLTAESRASDVVSRYGGEEFMLIFTETDLENALIIAERIRMRIEQKTFIQNDLKVTVSAGLIEYKGESFDQLLKSADDLLYQAKHLGRNRIETSLIR